MYAKVLTKERLRLVDDENPQDSYDKSAFRARVMALVDRFANRKISKLAELCKIPVSTLRKYTEAKSVPGADILVLIAKGTGVNLEWLATGEGPMFPGEIVAFKKNDDEILIPFFDIHAAAGNGLNAPDHESSLPPIAFKRAWLQGMGVTNTTYLQFLYAYGPSMEPKIRDQDFLLIDRDPDAVKALRDGVWVIREGNEIKVKRLQKVLGNLRVISDNPEWPVYTVPLDVVGTAIEIIGRVIWSGQRH